MYHTWKTISRIIQSEGKILDNYHEFKFYYSSILRLNKKKCLRKNERKK